MNSRIPLGIFLGVATYLALLGFGYYFAQAAFPGVSVPWPAWYGISRHVLEALGAVAPGFVAGWVACRSGVTVGAVVGILSALLTPLAVSMSWAGMLPLSSAFSVIAALDIGGIITGSVSGARWPPSSGSSRSPLTIRPSGPLRVGLV
jgi:hypothetical protein